MAENIPHIIIPVTFIKVYLIQLFSPKNTYFHFINTFY